MILSRILKIRVDIMYVKFRDGRRLWSMQGSR